MNILLLSKFLETNMSNDVVVIFKTKRCIKENIAYGKIPGEDKDKLNYFFK